MDATDVRLLRAMFPRIIGGGTAHPDDLRPAALARAVSLSVNAVKARIAKMEDEGLLRGFACFPPLAVLGLEGGAYLLRSLDRGARAAALREIEARGRLLRAYDYAGGHVCAEVAFAGAHEREEILAILRHAGGGAEPALWLQLEGHPPARPLTPLDWRILAAVRASPLATPAELAERVGVSARTVKRRVDRLVAENALWTLPKLDYARASGLLLVEMLFTLAPGDDARGRAAILRAFERERVWAFEPASHAVGHYDILVVASSTAEVEEMRERGEALPGVARVESLYFAGSEDRGAWLDRLVAERGQALASVPAPPPRGGAHP